MLVAAEIDCCRLDGRNDADQGSSILVLFAQRRCDRAGLGPRGGEVEGDAALARDVGAAVVTVGRSLLSQHLVAAAGRRPGTQIDFLGTPGSAQMVGPSPRAISAPRLSTRMKVGGQPKTTVPCPCSVNSTGDATAGDARARASCISATRPQVLGQMPAGGFQSIRQQVGGVGRARWRVSSVSGRRRPAGLRCGRLGPRNADLGEQRVPPRGRNQGGGGARETPDLAVMGQQREPGRFSFADRQWTRKVAVDSWKVRPNGPSRHMRPGGHRRLMFCPFRVMRPRVGRDLPRSVFGICPLSILTQVDLPAPPRGRLAPASSPARGPRRRRQFAPSTTPPKDLLMAVTSRIFTPPFSRAARGDGGGAGRCPVGKNQHQGDDCQPKHQSPQVGDPAGGRRRGRCTQSRRRRLVRPCFGRSRLAAPSAGRRLTGLKEI